MSLNARLVASNSAVSGVRQRTCQPWSANWSMTVTGIDSPLILSPTPVLKARNQPLHTFPYSNSLKDFGRHHNKNFTSTNYRKAHEKRSKNGCLWQAERS